MQKEKLNKKYSDPNGGFKNWVTMVESVKNQLQQIEAKNEVNMGKQDIPWFMGNICIP